MEGLAASNNAVFIDTTNARVGIGTISPGKSLDVVGSVKIGTSSATAFPFGDNVQIAGADAGLNLFMSGNPGNESSKESYIRFSGYDAVGTAQEIASISGKWYSTSASTGGAALRLNSMYMSGGTMQTAVDYRQCGKEGIGIFNGDVCPGTNRLFYVNGNITSAYGVSGATFSASGSVSLAYISGVVGIGMAAASATATLDVAGTGIKTSSFTAAGHDTLGVWYAWAPTWVGFSTDPTGTGKYWRNGKTVTVSWTTANSPVSNATNFTFTLPFTAKSSHSRYVVHALDNGVGNFSLVYTAAGSATATVYYGAAAANWTNSGTKDANIHFTYEIE